MITEAAAGNAGMSSAGVVQYIIFPVIVAALIGVGTMMAHLIRRVGMIEQGLAVLISTVSPPGSPNLRELVHAQAERTSKLEGLLTPQPGAMAATVAALRPSPHPGGNQ